MPTLKYIKMIEHAREHWMFWPLIFFLFIIGVYVFFLSEEGYIAYQYKLEEKKILEHKIAKLKEEKSNIKNTIGLLKDDKDALKKFTREFLLFDKKVLILKFLDNDLIVQRRKEKKVLLPKYQLSYIIISSFLIFFVTFLSFYLYKRRSKMIKVEEEVHES